MISYEKFVKSLGWVKCEYRTTKDEVELHLYFLDTDEDTISNVTVMEI